MQRSRGLVLVAIAIGAMGACTDNYGEGGGGLAMPDRDGVVGSARDYGGFVKAEHSPPPISGGTLTVSRDGKRAFAADSDRDRVFIVDLEGEKLLHDVALKTDDEPGRVIEDGSGRVHVALRRAGAIATIDPTTGTVTERRPVCALPRGLAWDSELNKLHVTCAGGELVTMPVTGDEKPSVLRFDDDLRDVVVQNGHLLVSHFRSGAMMVVDRAGKQLSTTHLRPVSLAADAIFDPAVAWRMRGLPTRGGVAIVHQRGGARSVSTAPGGYAQSGPCVSSIVHSAIAIVSESGEVTESPPIPGSVLPVDLAVSDDGSQVAIVNAGNWKGPDARVHVFQMNVIVPPTGTTPPMPSDPKTVERNCLGSGVIPLIDGNAIAVEFDRKGRVIVQTREPARLEIRGIASSTQRTIELSSISVDDTGHDIFHLAASVGGGVACASCHPEGGDDGRTWVFQGLGRRRTQTLRGGIMQTAPFHWAGDETNITALMNDVFARRMQGGLLTPQHIEALSGWLDKVPALPRIMPIEPITVAAADRGKALFNGDAQCSTCHYGPLYTNHQTVDVGTGAPFQVPVLAGIRFRSPFMHDGCAKTLLDRFSSTCGGGDAHGKTSQLSPAQLADLVAYLETL